MSNYVADALVGEPEVLEDGRTPDLARSPAWLSLKHAATALQAVQAQDGSIPEPGAHPDARGWVADITTAITELAAALPARRRLSGRRGGRLRPLGGRGVRRARLLSTR